MGDDCRFKIPEECRKFGDTSEECLIEKRQVAEEFIQKFTKQVAPPKYLDCSNKAWTQSVRRRFIEICPEGCYALPSDPLTRKGEHLVDYTWAEVENGKRVLLASESEWGSDKYGKPHWYRVEEDFEKLLSVKAPFKVLIFSSNCKVGESLGSVEGDFSIGFAKRMLETSLGNYGHHIPGEVYIFIDFPQTGVADSPGIFRSFIWLADQYGKAKVELRKAGHGDLIRPTSS